METKKTFLILLLIFIFFLNSCAKSLKLEEPLFIKQESQQNNTLQEEFTGLEKITNETLSKKLETLEEIKIPIYPTKLQTKPLPPPPEKKEEEKKVIDYVNLVGIKKPVVLNVENMPLNDFIVYVLGELLKVPFIIDDEVMKMTNPVTLRLPKELSSEEVLEAVVEYFLKLGLEVSQKGKVLVISKPKPRPSPPPSRIEQVIIGKETIQTSARIAQFIPLKYLRPFEIEQFIKDFFPGLFIEIKTFPKENALLIIGPGYQITPIIELIDLLDIPYFVGKHIYFQKLIYWNPEDLVKELTNILSKLGYPIANNIKDPGILLIPLRVLNAIIAAFPDEQSKRLTLEWIKKFDSPETTGSELRYYIYKPRYSKATELAESISKLLTGQVKFVPSAPTPQPSPTQVKTQPGIQISTQTLTITADERRNMLLIYTTPSHYNQLLLLIKELDKPPKQVLIEATILELTLKDDLRFGLEWFITNKLTEGNYTLGQLLGVPKGPGLTFTLITDTQRFNLLINAFASKGLTNILSTPRILVLDNQAATIQVGTDIPIVTGEIASAQATIGNQTGIVRSIQYRNTGIILNVKPTIYTDDMLQLDITQEVSEMGASPPGLESPTVLVRKINTAVVAGNGQTIVLGGLISNTTGKEENKIPFLGDIPFLGNLFKTWNREEKKTELLVLLRPYILKSLDEASAITQELKERLKWLK